MDKFYTHKPKEIMQEFGTTESGLTLSRVTENRAQYGENKLQEKKSKSTLQIFLEQFKDLLVIILIVAALISAATGNLESTLVIIAVLILNAILGTAQTIKAEKSLESLKKLSSPTARVIRDGEQQIIDAADLVWATSSCWRLGISFREMVESSRTSP